MERYGELVIMFDCFELMENAQKGEKRQNFIEEIMKIGGDSGEWNGYIDVLVLNRFPQLKVPDVRDWLDNHGFIGADVSFMERPEQ